VAIVIRGKSQCHLCGQVMSAEHQLDLFPPGLFPADSASAHLNDASVHSRCLDQRPEAEAARATLSEYVDKWG